jgi:hypothetical protein
MAPAPEKATCSAGGAHGLAHTQDLERHIFGCTEFRKRKQIIEDESLWDQLYDCDEQENPTLPWLSTGGNPAETQRATDKKKAKIKLLKYISAERLRGEMKRIDIIRNELKQPKTDNLVEIYERSLQDWRDMNARKKTSPGERENMIPVDATGGPSASNMPGQATPAFTRDSQLHVQPINDKRSTANPRATPKEKNEQKNHKKLLEEALDTIIREYKDTALQASTDENGNTALQAPTGENGNTALQAPADENVNTVQEASNEPYDMKKDVKIMVVQLKPIEDSKDNEGGQVNEQNEKVGLLKPDQKEPGKDCVYMDVFPNQFISIGDMFKTEFIRLEGEGQMKLIRYFHIAYNNMRVSGSFCPVQVSKG